ncbi:hypothetical protein FA95DRAFT_1576820 [Auriscalpium vulgare]|uniref:Uncharacterized protein n=1 Tax=Auriscalpium vulgare TaxID=40419 RepID=A0ACB8R975_9AGAM|nr:hypothetical protein FA95DRAFT_1576820 [Auriscalpium vulgare]
MTVTRGTQQGSQLGEHKLRTSDAPCEQVWSGDADAGGADGVAPATAVARQSRTVCPQFAKKPNLAMSPKNYYGFAVDEVKLYADGVANQSISRLPDAAELQTKDDKDHHAGHVYMSVFNARNRMLRIARARAIKHLKMEVIEFKLARGSGSHGTVWVLPQKYEPGSITTEDEGRLEIFKQVVGIPHDERPSWFTPYTPLAAEKLAPKSVINHIWGLMKAASNEANEATAE